MVQNVDQEEQPSPGIGNRLIRHPLAVKTGLNLTRVLKPCLNFSAPCLGRLQRFRQGLILQDISFGCGKFLEQFTFEIR